MSELFCRDAQPNDLIPRFYLTHDAMAKTLDYRIPRSDIEIAVPLQKPPRGLQTEQPIIPLGEALESYATQNVGGDITITHDETFAIASLRLHSLPRYDDIDESIQYYRD